MAEKNELRNSAKTWHIFIGAVYALTQIYVKK